MKRLAASAVAASIAISSVYAGEFDESVCVKSATDEGYQNVESLCSCLAQKSADSSALDEALALMQSQSPEDRNPPQDAIDAIDSCTS